MSGCCHSCDPFETRAPRAAREAKRMSEEGARQLDISIIRAVEDCAETCVDDLLRRLAAHSSIGPLPRRRQALIARTTSALLRIIADESQSVDGQRH